MNGSNFIDSQTLEASAFMRRADGDVDLKEVDFSKFNVPACTHCGVGVLKPGLYI